MNTVTHVFDASDVYGSSSAELTKLRDGKTRKLKEQIIDGRRLPPADFENCPSAERESKRCPFIGGDTRINETRE